MSDTETLDTGELMRLADPVVAFYARKYARAAHLDVDDMEQELRMALFKELLAFFEPTKSTWSKFARCRAQARAIDMCRRNGQFTKRGNRKRISVQGSLDAEEYRGQEPPSCDVSVDANLQWRELSSRVQGRVAKMAIDYFANEMSMKEVGAKYGVTESRVSQLLKDGDRWKPELIGVFGAT